MSVTIDRDLGWAKTRQLLRGLKRAYTKVGVQEGARAKGKGGGGATFSSLVTVAAANEFGTHTIPARPFLRFTYDEEQDNVARLLRSEADKVIAGKREIRKSLALVGEYFQARVVAKIDSNMPPPNAPSTIRAKRSSHTLIDSGQLKQSIRHVEVLS